MDAETRPRVVSSTRAREEGCTLERASSKASESCEARRGGHQAWLMVVQWQRGGKDEFVQAQASCGRCAGAGEVGRLSKDRGGEALRKAERCREDDQLSGSAVSERFGWSRYHSDWHVSEYNRSHTQKGKETSGLAHKQRQVAASLLSLTLRSIRSFSGDLLM